MYGLVNQAVEDLVVTNFGKEKWDAIKSKAGIETEVFVGNDPYPDEITYQLIGAATEVLGLPADDILVAFGKHWVLETALKSYGPMMRSGGSSLKEFLVNLPNFHTRVAMIYPNLEPPRFVVSDVGDDSLNLHYHTHREGLTSFVVGLVHGIAEMYETECTVEPLKRKAEGADHDEFRVHWKASHAS